MAKRFFDSELFRKYWFRRTPDIYRAFWVYGLCECNHAGFLEYDPERFMFDLGGRELQYSLEDFEFEKLKNVFGDRIYHLENDRKLWFASYVTFQYTTLTTTNRVHISVINELEKRGMLETYKGLVRPLNGSKDKAKDKEKVKEKDRKGKRLQDINLEDCKKKFPKVDVELELTRFNAYLESKGKIYKSYPAAFRMWCTSPYTKTKEDDPDKPVVYQCPIHPKITYTTETTGLYKHCPQCSETGRTTRLTEVNDG